MIAKIELPEGKEGFGERLRFLLFKNNMNARMLAEQIDSNRQTVYMYLYNKSRPKLENCFRICKILGCSMDFLILGKEEE